MRLHPLAVACGLALAWAAAWAEAPARAAPAAGEAAQRDVLPPPPGLIWEEKWHESGAATGMVPVDPAKSVRHPDLELKLYGPGARLMILGKDDDPDNKTRVFSGEAAGPMVVAWRHRKGFNDLTGQSRIRVASTMSGLHRLYPTVKLANGDWYLADRSTNSMTRAWVTEELPLIEARWIKLDIANVVTKGNFVDRIDLSKVDEVGFTDLMPPSGHGPGGWFMLSEVAVYGRSVPR